MCAGGPRFSFPGNCNSEQGGSVMVGRTWIVAVLAVGLAAPVGASAREGSRFRVPVRSDGGVVAAESRLAAQAGLAVLNEGGNAIDAAVTTVFAVGITRPEMCGIGGGGFLVYRGRQGDRAALDFREKAPSTYAFTQGVSVGPLLAFGTGHNVVGVPGMVAGMNAALKRYGTISLARAVAPAEKLAREGFPVNSETSYWMDQHRSRLMLFPHAAQTYLKAGAVPYEPGETLKLPEYAASLRKLMESGSDAFYRGPIAEAIAKEMAKPTMLPGDQGTMTAQDLANYRAVWRDPLHGTYRGYGVVAMPPPTSGGLLAVETLNLLERFDVASLGASSADHLHLMAEAQKIAWADRNAYVGDPDFVDVPVSTMTSKDYAARRATEISMRRAGTYEAKAGGVTQGSTPLSDRGTHTTHVSVIDQAGNAVSVTCTIEQPFGSAVVPDDGGFLLNNQLTDFGAPGSANEPRPNKRPRSSTSPTIVSSHGKPVLAIGGSGGSTIPMGIINAIVRLSDFGEDVAHAVDAERIDARGSCGQTSPMMICLEETRLAPGVTDELQRRGHELLLGGEYAVSPHVQAAGWDLATGQRLATSDPRNAPDDNPGAVGQ